MLKTMARKFKLVVVFVLIVVMVTPPVTLTAQPHVHVIEPFYVDHMQTGQMPNFHAQEQFLEAPNPHCAVEQAMIDELLHEQANLWMQEPSVRDALRFYELRNSQITYSSLSEEDRHLVLQQLDIAETAFATANELFVMMERDGLLLPKSIDVMVIVSGGLFSYIEAKQLIASIPNMIERNTEIMRFERFVQNFDIPAEVRARNLMNNSFVHADIDRIQPEFTTPDSLEVVLLPDRSTSPGGLQVMLSTTPGSLEVTLSPDRVAPSFDLARQMFLDGHGATEIQTAFALGAALDVEPEAFLLPRGVYRAQSAVMFAKYGISSFQEPVHAATAFSTDSFNDFDPVPTIPTPVRLVQPMFSAMEYPFNIALVMDIMDNDASELCHLIDYGLSILGFDIEPMNAPFLPVHDNIVQDPFSLNFNAGESVSLNTGAVMFRTNVLNLPGRGGFGFNLDLVYNSAEADFRKPGAVIDFSLRCGECGRHVERFNSQHYNQGTLVNSSNCTGCGTTIEWCLRCGFRLGQQGCQCRFHRHPNPERHNPHRLGVGWKFDLPYILENVLYVPGRGSFVMEDYGSHISLRLQGPSTQGMRVFFDSTFTTGNNHRSDLRLTFYDGVSYFFGNIAGRGGHGRDRGYLIGMRDRFGNTISFEYEMGFNNQIVLSRVIDSNGKHINFQYQLVGDNLTLTITDPAGGSYIINMSRAHSASDFWHPRPENLFQLDSVQNQVGAVTSFVYNRAWFHFRTNTHPHVAVHAFGSTTLLLTHVNYPSGAQLRFTYGWRNIGLGYNGFRNWYFATRRELFSNGRIYQQTTFSYQNCHTAYPQWGYILPAGHTYSTTVTQNNGLRTVYDFNFRHFNTIQRTYNANRILLYTRPGSSRFPNTIGITEYSGSFSRTNIQHLFRNSSGQVTLSISPLAQGSNHERYRTITTYDARFGLPTTTTFMPDANTTVRTVNRLSADGRSIVGTDIYENNIRMSRTDFLHDQFGNITEIREFPSATGGEFVSTQFTFDRGTMPTSIRTTNVRYANGFLLAGTGIVERRFTYDAMWRVLSETDPMGYITRWAYDRLGRVTQVTHPNGGFETYTYNDWANTLAHRTILGATYTHQFDGLGNLLTITDPAGTVILRNIYDNRMRVTETQNAQGIASSQRTVFFYDVFDRVTDMRRLNPASSIMYRETIDFQDISDAAGNRRVTNIIHDDIFAPSIQNFVQYDRFGRRTQEGTVGGRILTYTHDLAGRVVTEQSLGINNTFTHNLFGIISVRNIEGNTSRSTFDSMGRLLTATDLMGNTQRFTYDALGRLIRQDVPFERAGTVTRYATTLYFYDRNGNLVQTRIATNLPGTVETWSITHNTFHHNRLMSSQTGDGPFTDFTYDLAGNIRTQRVGGIGGATTTFTYNNRGQLTHTTDALGQAETFTYDVNGLLSSRTDRNGTRFIKAYDHMGRLGWEIAIQNNTTVGNRAYLFTLTGAVRTEISDDHVINNYYDAQGRLMRQTETGGIVRTFAYNAANNITDGRVYVNGVRHYHNTYTFDTAQRVHTVTTNGQLLATYTYNANGSRIRTALSSRIITDYTRNLAGLVTRQSHQGGAGLVHLYYTYYLDGNISTVTERRSGTLIRTVTYNYDTARRLIGERDVSINLGETNRRYSFDNRGNRTNMTVTGAENYTVAYTYDLNNRLLTQTRTGSDPSVTTLTYDRNGNQLTSNSNNGRTETRMYNAFNQLIRTDSVSPYGVFSTEEIPLDTFAETADNWWEYFGLADYSDMGTDIIGMQAQLDSTNAPSFGWNIFNNGPGGTQYPRVNPGLAASGTIRLWTQLNGVNATVYTAAEDTIVALDQNGNCAMRFITVNRMWVAGAGWTDINRIDVSKNGNWQYINLSITVHGETVHVLLANARFEYFSQPRSVQITFNANGGTVTPSSITRNAGERLGPLPFPLKANYSFNGWFTAPTGGTPVSSATIVLINDVTYYAQWIPRRAVTITFDANGGTVTPSSVTRNSGDSIGELPTPTRTNYDFVGWYTALTGGVRITEATVVTRDVTYFARWVRQTVTVTITLNANGGTVTPPSVTRNAGAAMGELPTPTRANYDFVGWYTAATGGVRITESTIVPSSNATYFARWVRQTVTVTITLNANGGTVTPPSITRNAGAVMGELPTPTRANHRFVGWYTAATGGTRVTALTIAPANNVTYFARWVPELVSTTSTYTYRADGLRHSKTVNGVTTYHIWDRGNIVLELNVRGAVTNRFERGARGQLIRSLHHGLYLHDARGSVVQRVNDAGQVLRNYWYTAFGVEFFPNFTNSNPFQFNGEYWDAHRGEYYLRARSYNPRTGRFSSPDPFFHVLNGNINDSPLNILQAGNLFMFCGHDPVNRIDPSGLNFIIAWSYSGGDVNTFNQWLLDNGHTNTLMTGTGNWTDAHWAEFDSRDAFSRAAQTLRNNLIARGIPESEIHLHRIDSRAQLEGLWNTWAQFDIVEGFDLFSHWVDVRGGSGDFWNNAARLNWGSTLRQLTIDGRSVGFISSPYAAFHGCFTAAAASGQISAAQNFANRQGVRTLGNVDGSNFAHSPNYRFRRIDPHGTNLGIYLGVFNWRGARVPMTAFTPQT